MDIKEKKRDGDMKELEVLYEDDCLLVVYKPAKIPVQSKSLTMIDLVSMVRNYLSTQDNNGDGGIPYVGVIHRLDQPVEGIVVFAKTPKGAGELSRQIAQGKMTKLYRAIVHGRMKEEKGTLENWLYKDGKTNRSSVVKKEKQGSKKAKLSYSLLEASEEVGLEQEYSLIEIKLDTGRHHQIRVQFSFAGHPLVGDKKYGIEDESQNLALCAYYLQFIHPETKKEVTFEISPKGECFKNNFSFI